jgi:zinc transport system ATP-binding protein
METGNAISLSNINLIATNNRCILKNINLDIKKGEFVSIIGHNGAGKTSLLKLINGLINPTSGTIKIFTKNINNDLKKHIGYIPQTNFFENNIPINVRQTIEIGLTAKNGIFSKISYSDKLFVEDIAKKIGIFNLLDTPIGKLSGGQMQKVSVARVLAQEAKILLLDEPLSNLDTNSQQDVIEILEHIYKQENVTILLVIHNQKLIPKCCNKTVTLENGEIKIIDEH